MTPTEKDQIIERELAQVKEEQTAIDGLPEDVERVLRCLHDHLFDESFDVNAIIACSGVRPSIAVCSRKKTPRSRKKNAWPRRY